MDRQIVKLEPPKSGADFTEIGIMGPQGASFCYPGSINLGDQIQSLAVEQYLTTTHSFVDRDNLRSAAVDQQVIVMNGWFSHKPENWPPNPLLKLIYFGFHMTDLNRTVEYFTRQSSIEHFRKFEPIGCRDHRTALILKQYGVQAFVSYCLTLTFPRQPIRKTADSVYIVDGEGLPLPSKIARKGVYLSHLVTRDWSEESKRARARELLEIYREKARLVITTRLHCALPCVALGIPVVFFGNPDDPRINWVRDFGLEVQPLQEKSGSSGGLIANKCWSFIQRRNARFSVNWSPAALDIEELKNDIRNKFKSALFRVVTSK